MPQNDLLLQVPAFVGFFTHGMSICFLIDRILVKRKFKIYSHIISALIYAFLALTSLHFTQGKLGIVYLLLLSFYVLDFLFRYEYLNVFSVFMCALAIILHVMSAFAITLSFYSLQTGLSFNALLSSTYLYHILAFTTLVLSVCTFCVKQLIPAKYYSIICANKEQILFLNVLFGLFVFFMVVNTSIFSTETREIALIINEILVSFVMLCGMYLGFLFLVRINSLQIYKEKTKTLEEELYRDRRYKEMMLSDTLITYELNCNQDILYKVTEGGKENLGIDGQSYSSVISELHKNHIYSEDKKHFLETMMPEHLVFAYEEGRREIVLEYRRLRETGDYGWVRTVINTAQDKESGEVTAVILVKDIDKEKHKQLSLQYRAERDSLTGAYNKAMVHKSIATFLKEDRQGVLLILDVDDFKNVNDKMGHLYGDAVLCEFVRKVKTAFRNEDMVGRVGGDEFLIFMRNIASEYAVSQKADALCHSIDNTKIWDGISQCHVSCSVGIAIAPQHGTTFDELYHHADIALYTSKNKGKNTYSIYQGEEAKGPVLHTAIDSNKADISP